MIPYGKQSVSEEDIEAVVKVLRSDYLTSGPSVREFEEAFADLCGAKYAVSCCNGTAALHLAMLAAEIGEGNRVVTTPNTFLASANAAAYVGATADFCDVEESSRCLSAESLEETWYDDTKAVVAVDYAGHPVDGASIKKVASRNGAILIEDACHSIGTKFSVDGEAYSVGGGHWADITTFSLHPVKTLTSGEGGMIVTNQKEYADRARLFREHGITRDSEMFSFFGAGNSFAKESQVGQLYEMTELGFNYRLSEIHSALGLSQLSRLFDFIDRRIEVVEAYNEAFSEIAHVKTPVLADWIDQTGENRISWHLYVIQVDWPSIGFGRDEFMTQLRERGVLSQVHYLPVHLQPYYQKTYGYSIGKCPVAERFAQEAISLPLYFEMTDSDVQTVIDSVISLLENSQAN